MLTAKDDPSTTGAARFLAEWVLLLVACAAIVVPWFIGVGWLLGWCFGWL